MKKLLMFLLFFVFSISFVFAKNNYQQGMVVVKLKKVDAMPLFAAPSSSLVSFSKSTKLESILQKYQTKLEKFKISKVKEALSNTPLGANAQNVVPLRMHTRNLAYYDNGFDRIFKIEFSEDKDVFEMLQILRDDPDIEWIEPYPVFKPLSVTPNDPKFNLQWYFTESSSKHLNIQKAWELTTGNSSVVVAVIDTAFKISHEDLAGNMVSGKDFGENDFDVTPDPNVDQSHGTHVASTVGAITNNSKGIAGVVWSAKIMPLKCSQFGSNLISNWDEAIFYAAENGAKVINMSFGDYYTEPDTLNYIQTVVNYAYAFGAVSVASAGNGNTTPIVYPARSNHVIAVAATNSGNEKAYFSDYGSSVDLSAPGLLIQVADDASDTSYTQEAGTSFSAPLVSGICALLFSVNPDLDPDDIETILEDTAVNIDDINSSYAEKLGTGVPDVYEAVKAAIRANEPTNINVTSLLFSNGSVPFEANWSKPSDIGTIDEYFYKLAKKISETDYELATSDWTSLGISTYCVLTDTDFVDEDEVYILVKARDTSGKESIMISSTTATYFDIKAKAEISSSKYPLEVGQQTVTLSINSSVSISSDPVVTYTLPFETEVSTLSLSLVSTYTWQGTLDIPETFAESGFVQFDTESRDDDGDLIVFISTSSYLPFIAPSINAGIVDSDVDFYNSYIQILAETFSEEVIVKVIDRDKDYAIVKSSLDNLANNYFRKFAEKYGIFKDFEILSSNNANITTFDKDITVKVPYPEVSQTGVAIVDLGLYSLNQTSLQWEKISYTVDYTNKTFNADVSHFSIYAVLQTGSNLNDVVCYPNPCYVGDGKVLKIGKVTAGKTDIEVKIYDISGKIVRKLDHTHIQTDVYGSDVVWDGKDKSGEEVASGVYIFIIKDLGSNNKKIDKAAILW